jgi:hypothetical protein
MESRGLLLSGSSEMTGRKGAAEMSCISTVGWVQGGKFPTPQPRCRAVKLGRITALQPLRVEEESRNARRISQHTVQNAITDA